MKSLRIDIMVGDRFFCSLRYPCKPHPVLVDGELVNVDLDEDELKEYIESKFPSLKGKQYSIGL